MNILSFWLGDELFGIDLCNVKEINRNVEYTTVPRADKKIVGLFNMRGQVVTLFDLAAILGYSNKKPSGKVTCIILDLENNTTEQRGFIIDKSGDVMEVDENQCEMPPANINSFECKFIKTIVRLENNILRVVELPELLN
jgi:purine-binding chemotaxis protein CheW